MRRFAAWLFSDYRLAIVLPLILAVVYVSCSHGRSLIGAIEASWIYAEKTREQAEVDRAIREMAPHRERVRLADAVLAKN